MEGDKEPKHDPSVKANQTAKKIQRSLNILIAATIVLFAVNAGLAGWILSISKANNDGLCSLRANAEERVESSERFLEANPKGAFGFSAVEIKRQIETSKRSVQALDGLSCPPRVIEKEGP